MILRAKLGPSTKYRAGSGSRPTHNSERVRVHAALSESMKDMGIQGKGELTINPHFSVRPHAPSA